MQKTDKSNALAISDTAERERAVDPASSFIVQAPAGSGKTGLLMQRYLKLLSTCLLPENILAMTFTKKAAGEMRSRIISALESARTGSRPENPHDARTYDFAMAVIETDKKLGWGLIDDPGRLKIRTFDSFCNSIARQTPLLSSNASSDVTDNPEEMYEEAALRTIKLIETKGDEAKIVLDALEHMDGSTEALSSRLVAMLKKRDQWLRHFNINANDARLRATLEENLRSTINAELLLIESSIDRELRSHLPLLARFAARNIKENGTDSPITALDGLTEMPPPDASALSAWLGLAELLLTKDGNWRKNIDIRTGFPATKEDEFREMKECLKEHLERLEGETELSELLHRTRLLPSPAYTDDEWNALQAIIKLLPIAAGKLTDLFTETGKSDFLHIAISAISALSGSEDGGAVEDILLRLDMRLKHILVDEFQDTSYAQKRLLELLTSGWEQGDGRTLFLVGDPMQSIFLFREATVGIYLEARTSGIGGVALTPVTLKTNFRAQEKLVNWVNETFSHAFARTENANTGATTYAPSSAVKAAIKDAGASIELFGARNDHSEASRILSIIKDLPMDEHTAILCRARNHLAAIVELLKKEGVGFRARGFDPLSGRAVIKDLLALYRAIFQPFDSIAWLSILRAPWAGIRLNDIHKLCLNSSGAPVIELMKDEKRLALLSENGSSRIKSIRAHLENATALRSRINPAALVEGLWVSLGGPACLDGRMDMDDAEMFFDALTKAGVGGGIDSLITDIEDRIERLYAQHGHPASRLEILTIHDAKGLEFDNVIVPGLGKKNRNNDKDLVLWAEGEAGLTIAPVEAKNSKDSLKSYKYLSSLKNEKIANETARLFYVAVTRAKKRLYLSGHVKADEGGISAAKGSFLSLIEPGLTTAMIRPALNYSNVLSEHVKPQNRIRRLKTGYKMPEPKVPIAASAPQKETQGDKHPEFYWAGESIRHIGTVVHRYLCRIGREGLVNWNAARIKEEAGGIISMLKGLGLGAIDAKQHAAKAGEILLKAISDEIGRKILANRDTDGHELAITAFIDGTIIRSVIDRTYVDEHGVRWVIDYKTGTHEGGSVEEFLASERARYSSQLNGYEEALRAAGETRPIKKGLYYPALGRFIEC